MRRAIVSCIVVGFSLVVLGVLRRQSPPPAQRREPASAPTNSQAALVELLPVASRNEYGVHGFSDIAILDHGEMWAVGYDGQDPRRMWRSLDGGESWQRVPIRSSGFTLHSITFSDSRHGFAVGGSGTIMITIDGGENWIQTSRSTAADLECVSFASPSVGYVAGRTGTYDRDTDTSTYGVEVLRTNDGGRTWRCSYRDYESRSVWQLVTPSEKTAFLLLDASRLLRTTDEGKTWQELLFKYRGPTSIAFTKDGTGWMVGEDLFYRSTDGGLVWRTPEDLPCELTKHNWWSIAFANAEIGMAVSEDCAIAMTYDGGLTWSEATSNMHSGKTIWYDERIGFKEHLRAVRLHDRWGVILGSQRLLSIKGLLKRN